jgi:hypothetical protein
LIATTISACLCTSFPSSGAHIIYAILVAREEKPKKKGTSGCDRISTGIGCPGVMPILSHELAMNGQPGLETGGVLLIIGCWFCGSKEVLYSTSRWWVALLHAVAASNLQPRQK